MKKSFPSFLEETRELVDQELLSFLESSTWGEDFKEAAQHTMLSAGKAFRPALFWAFFESLKKEGASTPSASARKVALALEMMHTYSLIHDDLPCMDDDDLRRGKPTLHKVKNEAYAVLSGDALLTGVFEVLALAFLPDSLEGGQASLQSIKAAEAVKVLAQAAGASGMIQGQWMDMANTEDSKESLEKLVHIHLEKTGALIGASTQLAALCALDYSEYREKAQAYRTWGRGLGLLFQIKDDLLDVEVGSAELGKTAGKDSAQGKDTFANLLSAQELLDTVEKKRNELDSQVPESSLEKLGREIVDFVVQRKK